MRTAPIPFFKVGDLVRGYYDFADHIYYPVSEDLPPHFRRHVGVVVSIEHENYYFGEYIYCVLCVDGIKRFFLEQEIAHMSN